MDKALIRRIIEEINFMASQTNYIKIMEVCGTHTQMIAKSGIKSILSPDIKLLSGPGCPVCVSEESYIDNAIELLKHNVIIATFGDMIRVSGTKSNLLNEKSKGEDIRIIYSPFELIDMAEQIQGKNIVFLAVGFETTAPVIALTIKKAHERKIDNLFFLTSLKLMPPILHYIIGQTVNNINGFICPGHVASVTGSEHFRFIADDYNLSAAVCGFEPEDILMGIHCLVKQISQSTKKELYNLYTRCVKPEGNLIAKGLIKEVFEVSDGEWRGIGKIKNSSLYINENYKKYDALNAFKLEKKISKPNISCQCKDVLLGNITPKECKLFGKTCYPFKPYGPCMVSSEGACSIAYRYKEEV